MRGCVEVHAMVAVACLLRIVPLPLPFESSISSTLLKSLLTLKETKPQSAFHGFDLKMNETNGVDLVFFFFAADFSTFLRFLRLLAPNLFSILSPVIPREF